MSHIGGQDGDMSDEPSEQGPRPLPAAAKANIWLAFLAARVDEDEAVARGLHGATRFMGGEPDFYGQGGPAASAFWRHFTAHRMLREAAAGRLLIERYERLVRMKEAHDAAVAALATDLDHQERTGEWRGPGDYDTRRRALQREDDYLSWMLPAVRSLVEAKAVVYSDHPDYPLRSGPPSHPRHEQSIEQQGDQQAREHGTDPT